MNRTDRGSARFRFQIFSRLRSRCRSSCSSSPWPRNLETQRCSLRIGNSLNNSEPVKGTLQYLSIMKKIQKGTVLRFRRWCTLRTTHLVTFLFNWCIALSNHDVWDTVYSKIERERSKCTMLVGSFLLSKPMLLERIQNRTNKSQGSVCNGMKMKFEYHTIYIFPQRIVRWINSSIRNTCS